MVVTNYRHISHIGTKYKIIARLLENRLSVVMNNIVSNKKSMFIKGRQILDGPLMVDEIFDYDFRAD